MPKRKKTSNMPFNKKSKHNLGNYKKGNGRFKRLVTSVRSSRKQQIAFLVIFALVGGLLFKTFAYTPDTSDGTWNSLGPRVRWCESQDYAKGPNSAGASGAWQMIGSTWRSYAKQVPGASKYSEAYRTVTDNPSDPHPELQDQVAYRLFKRNGFNSTASWSPSYPCWKTDGRVTSVHDADSQHGNFPPLLFVANGSSPTGTPGGSGPSYSPPAPAPATKIDTGKNCPAYVFPRDISRSLTPYCVQKINERLRAWGYPAPAPPNDGTYNQTLVKQFQFSHHVPNSGCSSSFTTCDGVTGPGTWSALLSNSVSAAPAPKPPSSGGGGPTYSVSNRVPVGWVDNISCNQIKGWAFDPDTTNSIYVHIYVDGPAGGSPYPASSFLANFYRPDVNNAFKSKYGNIGDNHGFEFSLPSMYRNGQNHGVWVYAIDSAGGTNVFLKSGTTGPC